MTRWRLKRLTPAGFVLWGYLGTATLVCAVLLLILLSQTDPAKSGSSDYLPLTYAATATLLVSFGVGAFVRRADVVLARVFPLLVGAAALSASLVPWVVVFTGHRDLGSLVYGGLRVPQMDVQFWDLLLPLRSLDCAAAGADVYAANNGCLQDPTIYGPGFLWLQFLPGDLLSAAHVQRWGVLLVVASSLTLLWLARNSAGLGQVVLLIASVGGPWMLLLERGNLDAVVLWAAVATVILVRRWDTLWAWALAASLMWMIGTWKYYPFAMGIMLVPVVRLRRGWIVIAAYAAATSAYMVHSWPVFLVSSQANSNMTSFGDYQALGRTPVVARMVGFSVGEGMHAGDLLVGLVAVAAVAWGIVTALSIRRRLVYPAMLGAASGALYLSAILIAGFGWGYKATFLLLAVPLVAALTRNAPRPVVSSSVAVLALLGISAIVVWNTVLATLAGIVVAGFALGASGALLARSLRKPPASMAAKR